MHQSHSLLAAVGGVLIGAALIVLPWGLRGATPAHANHPWFTSDSKHLYYQHWDSAGHGSLDEDFCVDDVTGATGDVTAYNMVWDALISNTPKWDRMNGADYRVDLYGVDVTGTGPCGIIDQNAVEIRYWINSTACATSCALQAGPIPSVSPRHHQWFNVHLRPGHTPPSNATEYRKNINHEAGHVWGLKDPDFVNQYSNGCFSSWGVNYYSVMHQYTAYCDTSGGYAVPTVVGPQGADYENVIAFQLPSH